jgi:2,5-furandicarboxylate decarboxylase 1
MPFQDLRAFLSTLKEAGELVDVNRPVALKYDVAKALAKSSALDGPALMFQQTGTGFPLVAGLYGNRRRALIAFESTESTIHGRVTRAIDNPIGPVDFSGKPPCQEFCRATIAT